MHELDADMKNVVDEFFSAKRADIASAIAAKAAVNAGGVVDEKTQKLARAPFRRATTFLMELEDPRLKKEAAAKLAREVSTEYGGVVPIAFVREQVNELHTHFASDIEALKKRPKRKSKSTGIKTHQDQVPSGDADTADAYGTHQAPDTLDVDLPEAEDMTDERFALPDVLDVEEAQAQRRKMLTAAKEQLTILRTSPTDILRTHEFDPYPHQLDKLGQLISDLLNESGTVMADITPTRGGKTFMEMALARLVQLQGDTTPVLYLTYSNPILTGEKGVVHEAQRFFPREEIGLVNQHNKEHGRRITMANFMTPKASPNFLQEFVRTCNGKLPLIILDEGDLFQTDMSLEIIQALQQAFKDPPIVAFSATKEVNDRNLADLGKISSEMQLYELMRMGLIKRMLGFYLDIGLELTPSKLQQTKYGQELRYSNLTELEQDALVVHPIQAYLEHARGQQSIFICSQIAHAEHLAATLRDEGITAECMSGRPEEYDDLIAKYVAGEIKVLTGCNVVGRGITLGGKTRNVFICSVTQSVSRLYHAVARGFDADDDVEVLRVFQVVPRIVTRGYRPALLGDLLPNEARADSDLPDVFAQVQDADQAFKNAYTTNPDLVGAVGIQLGDKERAVDTHLVRYLTRSDMRQALDTGKYLEKKRTINASF